MKFWKDIFWFYTLLFIILIVAIPFRGNVSLLGLLVLVASGITLIPLYGFSHQLPIGSKKIATAIFIYNVLLVLVGLIMSGYALMTHWGMGQVFMMLLVMLYMFVFLYPQYKYALKSKELWQVAIST